jgi:hypothetical protein
VGGDVILKEHIGCFHKCPHSKVAGLNKREEIYTFSSLAVVIEET